MQADAAIAAVVDKFYGRIMADSHVSGFFKGVDMERQRAKQTAFVTMAFGGPMMYTARGMNEAHRKLREEQGMDDSHFDAVAGHLQATLLEDFGLPQDLVAQALAIVGATREAVMGRASD